MSNKTAVLTQYDAQRKKYERFAKEIEHQLRSILEERGIVCSAITSRVKDRDSLAKKIDVKLDKYSDLAEVTDIAGVRVITYYDSDVELVSKIVEREFCVDAENSINKREALGPEKFGYCSVHYVVSMNGERLKLPENKGYAGIKCEIQIRTVLQHAWAEIEHDLGYKSEIAVPKAIRRSFSRLAGLLEVADKEFQEIRDFLTAYRERVEAEMEEGGPEAPDSELDAVVLEALINTNPRLQELNRRIGEIAGVEIAAREQKERYASAVQELKCLGVDTTARLDQLVERCAGLAVYIADKLLHGAQEAELKKVLPKKTTLVKTVGVLYLCYAELASNGWDKERIVRYLGDNKIGREESRAAFARELLEYGRAFAAQT